MTSLHVRCGRGQSLWATGQVITDTHPFSHYTFLVSEPGPDNGRPGTNRSQLRPHKAHHLVGDRCITNNSNVIHPRTGQNMYKIPQDFYSGICLDTRSSQTQVIPSLGVTGYLKHPGEFRGGPEVRTVGCEHQGPSFDPWSRNGGAGMAK